MTASKSANIKIGAWLKERRRALGMTQGDMGAFLGRHPNTIARYERGELRVPLIVLQFVNDFTKEVKSHE